MLVPSVAITRRLLCQPSSARPADCIVKISTLPVRWMSSSRPTQKGKDGGDDLDRGSFIENGRIHVLGLGNIAKLFAHSLARIPNRPPITLMFHRSSLVQAWEEGGREIELVTNGISKRQGGYDIEYVQPRCKGTSTASPQKSHADERDNSTHIIRNLIVDTKATNT